MFSLPYSFLQHRPAWFAILRSGREIKYKDPIVEEWNLTLERNLGKGIGFRASYDGNHGYNLPVVADYDRRPTNTSGFQPGTQAFPLSSSYRGYDDLGFTNFQAGTFSVHKRGANFQFEVSYTLTRNLTNLYGCAENSGASVCDGRRIRHCGVRSATSGHRLRQQAL